MSGANVGEGPLKPEVPARREYHPPILTRYGKVSKLTQRGTVAGADRAGMAMPCI